MPRPRIRDQEVSYLDAFWRELKVLEADYGAITHVLAQPSSRPGVFLYRVEFTPLEGKASELVGRQAISIEFPGSTTQTLAGALWSASMRLARQIGDQYSMMRARPRED